MQLLILPLLALRSLLLLREPQPLPLLLVPLPRFSLLHRPRPQPHPLSLTLLLPRSLSMPLLVPVLVQALACQVPRLRVLPLVLKVRLLQSRIRLVGAGRHGV